MAGPEKRSIVSHEAEHMANSQLAEAAGLGSAGLGDIRNLSKPADGAKAERNEYVLPETSKAAQGDKKSIANELSNMLTGSNGKGGETYEQLQKSHPDMARAVDETATRMAADPSMTTDKLRENLNIQAELYKAYDPSAKLNAESNQALKEAKMSDPALIDGVRQKANHLQGELDTGASRPAAVKHLGTELRQIKRDLQKFILND